MVTLTDFHCILILEYLPETAKSAAAAAERQSLEMNGKNIIIETSIF